ncbi:hypothetical protein GGX14DRAFT_554305 [Mycena pura]|uniref:Uncharacterized protein n=1 Tax=Mycena pura TaxID=153505 RepID=A0AAD6YSH2_9AGAR|nr:hypothetical protein GGX14DRAFT_554305 [Mycena pura]
MSAVLAKAGDPPPSDHLHKLLKVMKVGGELGTEYSYDADDYEKPVEGSKKRKAKPPRGAVKKQKVGGEKKKPRVKKVVSASTAARKATVKAIRGAAKGSARKNAKK